MTKFSQVQSGYVGNSKQWQIFFNKLTKQCQLDDKLKEYMSDNAKEFLATRGGDYHQINVSEINNQLLATENKLNIDLPQSFKDFYLADVSHIYNALIDGSMFPKVLCLSEVDTLQVHHPDLYESILINAQIQEQEESLESPESYYQLSNYSEHYSHSEFLSAFPLSTQKTCQEFIAIATDVSQEHSAFMIPCEKIHDNERIIWFDELDSTFSRFGSFAEYICYSIVFVLNNYYEVSIDDLKKFAVDNLIDLEILKNR